MSEQNGECQPVENGRSSVVPSGMPHIYIRRNVVFPIDGPRPMPSPEYVDRQFNFKRNSQICIDLTSSQNETSFKKTSHLQQHSKKKQFLNEDPDIFENEEECQELRVEVSNSDDKPVDSPEPGLVLVGTKKAVQELLETDQEPDCDTGIITSPEVMTIGIDKCYEEGEHFTSQFSVGKGAFGSLKLIQDKKTKQYLVVKKQLLHKRQKLEVSVQMFLTHQCLNKIYGLIIRGGEKSEIFMEYAGFPFDKVMGNERMRSLLTECNIIDIARQGFNVLNYLRHNKVMHLDIKPQNMCLNVLPNEYFRLKLCDFGSCCIFGNPPKATAWTPFYMAPEQARFALSLMLKHAKHCWSAEERSITPQADVYSFCCSLLFLYCGRHVLQNFFTQEIPSENQTAIFDFVALNGTIMRQFVEDSWDLRLKTVMLKSFCGNPEERITPELALQILSDEFPGQEIESSHGRTPERERTSVSRKRTLQDRQLLDQAVGGLHEPLSSEQMDFDSATPPKKAACPPTIDVSNDWPDESLPLPVGNVPNLGLLLFEDDVN